MSRRVLVASVAVVAAGAALLAAAGLWLPAVAVSGFALYPAGRWDRSRDRQQSIAELARRDARIAALEDELTYRYDAAHDGRWADGGRLMPDNGGGHYSTAVLHDRKTPDAAAVCGTSAPVRATRP